MERLTYRGKNGKGYIRNQGYYDKVYLNMAEVAERLTTYEDTGLEPMEVVALKETEQKRRDGCEFYNSSICHNCAAICWAGKPEPCNRYEKKHVERVDGPP